MNEQNRHFQTIFLFKTCAIIIISWEKWILLFRQKLWRGNQASPLSLSVQQAVMFCLVHKVLCTCRTVVSLQSCSWNVQWNPALRPARSDKTTSLLRPYSFKPNVKTIESFYYFKDPVNATTSLLRPGFYGPTVVALTGFHCICFIDLWQVPFPQDENKNLEPFFSNFFTNRKN